MTRLLTNRVTLAYLVVLILWIGASVLIRGFGVYGHLRYLVELSAVIGLVAVGQTIVVIGGGIDLSVGWVITVAAIGLPLLSPQWDPTGLIGIVATLAIGSAIGALNGLGIALLRVHPLIMTLAMASLLQGALVIFAGGSAVSGENPAVRWLGSARPAGIPVGIVLWLLCAAATLLFLHRTARGAQIFALGTNPLASRLSGVKVERTTVQLYTLSGLAAALAGILLLGMNGQGYVGIGDPYLLTSIAAVVLGGTSILGGRGSYGGTIAGAIMLTTISAITVVLGVPPSWQSIIFGSLVLGLLLISGREDKRR